MSLNQNPWVVELLSWRGDDQGGVRVPFSKSGGNPLRDEVGTIETEIIAKLRELASSLSSGEDAPRLVCLVGGPGNGKSEAVEVFCRELDERLGLAGRLVSILREKFTPNPLVSRLVGVTGSDFDTEADLFKTHIGELWVVQDASASERPACDAAGTLVEELELVLSTTPMPVFILCINRGVLTRALSLAQQESSESDVYRALAQMVTATSQIPSFETASNPCWPLDLEPPLSGVVACWPMDTQSLLLERDSGGLAVSPIETVLQEAVREENWEEEGKCIDCRDRRLCPFRQNATWLREDETRKNLLNLLRLSEFVTRQRWNFRTALSLCSELLVGEWADFEGHSHPCEWVHTQVDKLRKRKGGHVAGATRAAENLMSRLYPHAFVPVNRVGSLEQTVQKVAKSKGYSYTLALAQPVTLGAGGSYIRRFLHSEVGRALDPALHVDGEMTEIEDSYSLSVDRGNRMWLPQQGGIERLFLRLLKMAEGEWDLLATESAKATAATCFLRARGSCISKRSLGIRIGVHGGPRYLNEYQRILRDEDAWMHLTDEIVDLLGGENMNFDASGTFGQPKSGDDPLIGLKTMMRTRPISGAPKQTDYRPAHDLPFLEVADTALPVTFELYDAIMRRERGAPEGSLPPSVQASLDLIRHLHAGRECRTEAFKERRARYQIRGYGYIETNASGTPFFKRKRG